MNIARLVFKTGSSVVINVDWEILGTKSGMSEGESDTQVVWQ